MKDTTSRGMKPVRIIVPTGALGAGIREEHVQAGLAMGAHAIALDAGSTDSGPHYLATAKSKYSRGAVKSDLKVLLRAHKQSGIPILIGSCGTSGSDAGVDWTHDIVAEVATELGITPTVACLYSEQAPEAIAERARDGAVTPLAPMTDAKPETFANCRRIVALMGAEPYVDALKQGADVVLGGRTTDTAVIAAFALLKGAGAGPAWHGAKTTECGGQCGTNPRAGGVLLEVGGDYFSVEPLDPGNRCTPYTVSAHMLYENSDPFRLIEPGGILDVYEARYDAIDERRVRVVGSRFIPQPYTMKLEGAASGAYQTIMLVGIRDPKVLAEMDRFLAQMQEGLEGRVQQSMNLSAGDFTISLRAYGWTGLSGPPGGASGIIPGEVGVLFVATAQNQETATEIARTCNPWFFHMPLDREQQLPSYAFPFSPAEIERGECHEFRLNHVINVTSATELVRFQVHKGRVVANG